MWMDLQRLTNVCWCGLINLDVASHAWIEPKWQRIAGVVVVVAITVVAVVVVVVVITVGDGCWGSCMKY